MIKKAKLTFLGASYPYTLREIIQINGRQMAQIEKCQHLSYLNLSLYILVTSTEGQSFFLGYPNRAGWVPIHLIPSQWYNKITKVVGNCEENTRTMLPLRLCWAWTICKAKGQTIQGKVSLHLGRG